MSILSRISAGRHLDDDVLAEIWTAATAEGRTATHSHLAACGHCRTRYQDFARWLDELRAEAHSEADDVFPSERLAAQQAQIFRRLEALERPARIIAFPKLTRPIAASSRFVPRWVPTAVAAGLVVGLATGQFFDLAQFLDRPRPTPMEGRFAGDPGPGARSRAVQPASLSLDEALFYGDTDLEFTAGSARYLPTLDELTPRARDDFDRRR